MKIIRSQRQGTSFNGFLTVSLAAMLMSLAIPNASFAEKHLKEDKSAPKTEATFHNAPCQSWIDPFQPTVCCLLCIHGLGLNSGSYDNFGLRMAKHGIATYAIDVRGFGSWMKSQGHEEVDFNDCLEDVRTTLTSIRTNHPGKPVFLLGESMGGAIALRATSMYPELVDGLISSVPAGERFKQKKTDIKVALELLTGPNRQHNIGKQVIDQATKDEKLRSDWENDPLDRMDLSAKELWQFQKFMNENHDAAKQITKTAVLVVQGSNDKLVKPEGTWELFNEIESPQKNFMAVPSEHLIFEEEQDHGKSFDEKVAALVDAWMYSQLNQSKGDAHLLTDALLKQTKLNAQQSQRATLDWMSHSNGNTAGASGQTSIPLPLLRSVMKTAGITPAANAKQQHAATDPNQGAQAAQVPQGSFVLAFFAPWADECKSLDTLANQTKGGGQQTRLIKINVEDPDNAEIVKACSVGPIPTLVFVRPNGKIVSTLIGKNNFFDLAKSAGTATH